MCKAITEQNSNSFHAVFVGNAKDLKQFVTLNYFYSDAADYDMDKSEKYGTREQVEASDVIFD